MNFLDIVRTQLEIGYQLVPARNTHTRLYLSHKRDHMKDGPSVNGKKIILVEVLFCVAVFCSVLWIIASGKIMDNLVLSCNKHKFIAVP